MRWWLWKEELPERIFISFVPNLFSRFKSQHPPRRWMSWWPFAPKSRIAVDTMQTPRSIRPRYKSHLLTRHVLISHHPYSSSVIIPIFPQNIRGPFTKWTIDAPSPEQPAGQRWWPVLVREHICGSPGYVQQFGRLQHRRQSAGYVFRPSFDLPRFLHLILVPPDSHSDRCLRISQLAVHFVNTAQIRSIVSGSGEFIDGQVVEFDSSLEFHCNSSEWGG